MAETLTELVARISVDSAALKRGLSEAEGAAQKASKSIQQSFKDIGTAVTNVGKQLSMKLTAPIIGLGAAAFKMSGDFDQSFRKTNVMLKASAEEAVNYKKRILEISSASGIAAIDVVNAYYQIVSAGYRGADSLDILEVAARGAVGGAADLVTTTAALTKGMNIFQLEGVEGSTRAMDVFFGIVDTGLLSFEQMSQAFPNAASMAAALGVSIEEVGAALGSLTKVTGSTDDAATALNNTFMQLIKPSDKLLELYNEWGVKSGPEAIKKFGGFAGVLNKVREATGGNVDELAELFPSIRAIRAVLPLVTTNADDYASALDMVTNSQGRTNEAFNEMAEGPGFQLKQTFTIIKNASIKLGDTLASTLIPILKILGEKVDGLIQWWQGLSDGWRKTIIVAAGVLAAIGPVLIIFGQMAIGLSGLITLFQTFKIVQTLATAAQWLFNAAMSANPIGLVIIAIAALIAIGILLWQNWDTISQKAGEIWESIASFFVDVWGRIVNIFTEHWDKILAVLFPAIGLPILIARNWGMITDIVGGIWDRAIGKIKSAWQSVVDFVSGGVNWLINQVNRIINLINKIPGVNIGTIANIGSSPIRGFATGGIVPGVIGQPQLAVVHGGETIIPANEKGENIIVNFTQPVFFDREDTMNKFVDMISKGIDRKQRLRFGGAYSG